MITTNARTTDPVSRQAEFKKGDLVTFNAYKGEVIPARVIECLGVNEASGLHVYRLEGADKSKRLQTITSGSSIRESVNFVEPGEFGW
jgi:hypothetical protein